MLSTFHNLDRHICGIFKILREPNSRKMPPSKFLYDYIPIKQHFSNMTSMIPLDYIILNTLILAMIIIIKLAYELIESIIFILTLIDLLVATWRI